MSDSANSPNGSSLASSPCDHPRGWANICAGWASFCAGWAYFRAGWDCAVGRPSAAKIGVFWS